MSVAFLVVSHVSRHFGRHCDGWPKTLG